jgi:hypothetical protein
MAKRKAGSGFVPTTGTLVKRVVYLQASMVAEMFDYARRVGTNQSQLVRDFCREGLQRRKRAARKEVI